MRTTATFRRWALTVAGALVIASAVPRAGLVDSALADAAMRGDTAAISKLLSSGADVNAAQGDGMTALHWAALNGDAPLVGTLLSAKAAVDPTTRLAHYTPLHLAASRGHGDVVTRLLAAGAKPDAVTDTGVQPLHFAAQAGDVASVTALLAKGVDVNAVDATHGRTPLVFAATGNRLEVMSLLISRGADLKKPTAVIDYTERSRLDQAERAERNRRIAAETGRAVADVPDLNDPTPPGGNVGGGRAAAAPAQAAQARGAGGGGRAGAPGALGGRGGGGARGPSDTQIIGKQGGMTALHLAARDGYAAAVNLMLEAGLSVNTPTGGDESTPLLVAIANGQYDIAMTLLEEGADPNATNDDGMGPLFAVINNEWALRTWYPQPTAGRQQRTSYLTLMEKLIAAGADPNARMKSHVWHAAYNAGRMGVEYTGATPFWRAAYSLDVDAMRLLVKMGADPNIPTMTYGVAARPNDPSGMPAIPAGGPNVPPFHAASGVGYGTSRVAQQHRYVPDGWMAAAKYFIEELGVDVNIRDAAGYTALHHAAARGDNEMVLYLVKKGANVMAVARSGQTTVDMANSPEQRTQPYPETIKLLEGMGAKNNNNCAACK